VAGASRHEPLLEQVFGTAALIFAAASRGQVIEARADTIIAAASLPAAVVTSTQTARWPLIAGHAHTVPLTLVPPMPHETSVQDAEESATTTGTADNCSVQY